LSYVATACLLGTGLLVVGCGDDDGGGGGPVCGDGICEGDETIATCPEDCTPECGNGIVEQGEECDESDLANTDCADLGYEGGTLGCTDQCTFDTSQCTGGECGNDVVDQGEDCDGTDLGGSTCDSLGFAGGDLACAGDCTFDTAACCDDLCPALGDTQCVGDVVQTCSEAATGCLDWEDTEDCAANNQQCIEDPDGAFCAEPCTDECDTLDELQCNGDVIEICQEGGDGCYDWILDTDCAATSQTCGLVGGTPECVDIPTGGDTCADPIVITALPYTKDGSDFTADYTDTQAFEDGANCDGTLTGAADAIFILDLNAGETINVYETGGLDTVLHIMDTCDATSGTCLASGDLSTDESDGIYYTAMGAETVYIIVESWSGSPSTVDYSIHVDLVPPETDCANTTDDDGDGLTDCEDPDCFGQTGCTTETICGDGFDNDNDGQTDCDDTDCSSEPVCQPGQSCADPLVVTAFPYMISGTDVTVDFNNSADFSNATDCGTANGVDAVFQVSLNAGDVLHVWEMGGLDAVIRIMDICDPNAGTCLVSFDFGETDGEYFTAPATGDYYVILEAWSSSPWSVDYEFHMDLITTETDCGDGIDNDGDGDTDCDDADCTGDPACEPILGLWQEFEDGVTPFDMEGCSLSFSYVDPSYDYTYACTGLTDFPIPPGSGTQTATTVPLVDSDSAEYTIAGGWSFPFFGTDYTSFWVGSNGFVTFGEGDDSDGSASTFFDYPRIAAYDENLDPSDATGMVYVDEFADHVVVTFEAVTYYNGTDPNSFQMVMYQNGDIDFHYVYINQHSDLISGLSNGGQFGSAPPQTDFVPETPSAAGDVIITEIMYNPDAVNDSVGEYVEIYNPTTKNFTLEGCTIEDNVGVHTIGTLMIGSGEYAVLASSDDPAINGGINGAYSFGTDIQLGNSGGDVITITCGGTNLDIVDFESGWPCGAAGVSCQLNSNGYSETNNDDALWWCDSTDTYGDGDAGSPGAVNNDCATTLLYEGFETWPPAGWSIVDGGTSTDTWMQSDGTRTLQGGDGSYAMVDSDVLGAGVTLDEQLITPSLDCSGATIVLLSFYHRYEDYSGTADTGTVEISTDSGATWTPIVQFDSDTSEGQSESFDISTDAAGQADVMIRFVYTDGGDESWYWLVDDVTVIAL
jgi:hypothetical protein